MLVQVNKIYLRVSNVQLNAIIYLITETNKNFIEYELGLILMAVEPGVSSIS